MTGFTGRWVQRPGGVRVPVIDPDPPKVECRVCGSPTPAALCRPCRDSDRVRVHGSHAGFNQHQRRFENPCQSCAEAEKLYQGGRYRRGQLSKVDREWCEKNAVAHSWSTAERSARLTNV
jgi:hypothetical protein